MGHGVVHALLPLRQFNVHETSGQKFSRNDNGRVKGNNWKYYVVEVDPNHSVVEGDPKSVTNVCQHSFAGSMSFPSLHYLLGKVPYIP